MLILKKYNLINFSILEFEKFKIQLFYYYNLFLFNFYENYKFLNNITAYYKPMFISINHSEIKVQK